MISIKLTLNPCQRRGSGLDITTPQHNPLTSRYWQGEGGSAPEALGSQPRVPMPRPPFLAKLLGRRLYIILCRRRGGFKHWFQVGIRAGLAA